ASRFDWARRPWSASCSGSTAICTAKQTGVRTLGLVCLGSALAVLSIHAATGTEESRVIQGIVTAVGFLGAGVIVRSEKGRHVHGLTTAACVWVTACVGAACAIAQWQIVVIGVVLVIVILVFGGPFEKAIDRRWPGRPSQVSDQPPDRMPAPGADVKEIPLKFVVPQPSSDCVAPQSEDERAFNMLAASSNFVLLFPIFLKSRLA